jgi:hypothetical protein
MSSFIDLSGQTFGRFTVIERAKNVGRSDAHWLVRCSCGNVRVVRGASIRFGNSKSCGCLKIEITRLRSKTHGKSGTPEYKSWSGAIGRCHNPKNQAYKTYGALGIRVCLRWRGRRGFSNFLSDMGPRPSPNHSLDRKKFRLGYTPTNCRWATRQEQSDNRKNVTLVTHEGVTLSVYAWSLRLGMFPYVAYQRIRRGLTPAQALEFESSDVHRHTKSHRMEILLAERGRLTRRITEIDKIIENLTE